MNVGNLLLHRKEDHFLNLLDVSHICARMRRNDKGKRDLFNLFLERKDGLVKLHNSMRPLAFSYCSLYTPPSTLCPQGLFFFSSADNSTCRKNHRCY